METNKRITELRKQLALTQESFAERLGIKRSTVANIETNINPLTEANIKLICMTFNVNEQWLRTGRGEMFAENRSPLEAEILKMFRELSETAQMIIRDYIKMVLEQQKALAGKSIDETPEPTPESEPAFPLEPIRRPSERAASMADFEEDGIAG
jgi:transcriptional regulator with XRE-family HTH domain